MPRSHGFGRLFYTVKNQPSSLSILENPKTAPRIDSVDDMKSARGLGEDGSAGARNTGNWVKGRKSEGLG